MINKPSTNLETFENPNLEREYSIKITLPEFTCLCPKTGQPDFAKLFLEYVPSDKCIELKSLKFYIWSYRDKGAFHEAVTNQILSDLVKATNPKYMKLKAVFNVRGGVYTTVVCDHKSPDWNSNQVI